MSSNKKFETKISNRLKRFGYKYMGLAGRLWNLIWIIIGIIIIIIVLRFLTHVLFILPTTIPGAEEEIVNTYKSITSLLSSA